MPKMFDINYDRDNGKITVFIDDKMIIDYECSETYTEFRDVLDSIIVMAKHSGYMYTITASNRHDEDLKNVVKRGYFTNCCIDEDWN